MEDNFNNRLISLSGDSIIMSVLSKFINQFNYYDRQGVPGELWMEVHDIVQEAVIKTIPKKKKCKKPKWLSEEVLQIAVKRREVKGKGEKNNIPI